MPSLEPPSEPPGTWVVEDEMLQYIARVLQPAKPDEGADHDG